MNLIKEFEVYLLSLKSIPAAATLKNYLADIRQFSSWFETTYKKDFSPELVTSDMLAYFKKEKSAYLSSASLNRHFSSLRKFFFFLLLKKYIYEDPFIKEKLIGKTLSDPGHLKKFKDFLYSDNASKLTIKNYIIDLKQFFNWAETVTEVKNTWNSKEQNVLLFINDLLIEEYKKRLIENKLYSSSSINRKLSSLRRYMHWASENGLLDKNVRKAIMENIHSTNTDFDKIDKMLQKRLDEGKKTTNLEAKNDFKANTYSKFPPLRVAQKCVHGGIFIFDKLIVDPTAKLVSLIKLILWRTRGKIIFSKEYLIQKSLQTNNSVHNIPKSFFQPFNLSMKNFPLWKKIYHQIRFYRPKWYKEYHKYTIAHYFHVAILIIFISAIGFSFYNAFFTLAQNKNPTYAATSPPRILSFQARLTDNADTPITKESIIRFSLYNSLTASGSALLWQETDKVIPDLDGIFSTYLGNINSLPQSLFANNANLYLGITIGNDNELQPRQQLATVAYATNSETLQGLSPITATSDTTNVVLALDSSGNLTIGGSASPTFQATGGQLKLSGKSLLLTTTTGSNGNLELSPDGIGNIDLQKPIQNSTNYNNIQSALGAVEIDDLLAVLATSSGQSAFTINQNGIGPLISASSSGNAKFTLDSSGNGIFAGQVQLGNFSTLNQPTGIGPGSLYYDTTAQNILFYNGSSWVTLDSSSGSSSNLWSQVGGAIFPTPVGNNYDLLLGSNATASAKFAFINVNSGTPTASISGNITLNSSGVIATTNKQTLSIGDSGTGNIILAPGGTTALTIQGANLLANGSLSGLTSLTSSGTITFSGLSTSGIVHNNASGVLSTSAINLNGGSSEITGALPAENGGTGINTSSATGVPYLSGGTWSIDSNSLAVSHGGTGGSNFTTGGILYGNGSTALGASAQGNSGQCLLSGGTSSPTWGNCTTGGGTNLWSEANGTLFPVNATEDILFGGTSSNSAKFAFINVNSGTPTASISAGTTGATYVSADGKITTTAKQSLTLGDTTSGNIILAPGGTTALTIQGANLLANGSLSGLTSLTSSGTITFSGLSTSGIVHNNASGVLSTSAINLNGGSSEITGALPAENGGTGQTAVTTGDLLYGSATNTWSRLAGVATGNVLLSGGVTTAPSWGKVVLGTHTSGNYVSSVTGTSNQITASTTTGDITLSIPSDFRAPGTLNAVNGIYTGATAGTQRIDASGNLVNIGTITASGAISAATSSNTINGLIISSGALSGITGITFSSGNFDQSASSGTFQTGTGAVSLNGDTTIAAGKNLILAAGSGKLGIGVASPLATFDVRSNNGTTPVASISGQTSFASLVVDNSGAGDIFTASSSGLNRFVIKQSGRIGIGTTAPTALLDIRGQVYLNDGSSGSPTVSFNADTNTGFYRQNSDLLSFVANGQNAMNIDGTSGVGRLMIGNGSPVSRIQANDDNNNTASGITLGNSSSTYMQIYKSGSNQLTIGGGKVGLGTTTLLSTLDIRGQSGTISVASISGQTSFAALVADNKGVGDIFTASSSGLNRFVIRQSGNVGIGTTTPSFLLSAVAGVNSANAFALTNTSTTADTSTSVLRLNIGTATSDTNARFLEFYGGSSADNNGTRMGRIQLNNGGVTYTTGDGDFGEYFPVIEDVEAGDLIATKITGNGKALQGDHLLGVVSDSAGFLGNAKDDKPNERKAIVGLMGQIYTKVSTENGTIQKGDFLTGSSISGVAMKATKSGQVIGKALEDYTPTNPRTIAKILVFVTTSWYDPDVYLTDTGDFHFIKDTSTSTPVYAIHTNSSDPVKRIGAFFKLAVANINAGIITTEELSTNVLAITSENVTINGHKLKDYLNTIVTQAVDTALKNQQTISPIADIDTIHTNIISPLGKDVNLTIQLGTPSGTNLHPELMIKNASGDVVGTVDDKGNSSFSGKLASNMLDVSSDATISGTLHANRIIADDIEGLNAKIGTLSASTINNITNMYFATSSGEQNKSKNDDLSDNFANIASFSGTFAYIPNLHVNMGAFEQGLLSLGPTSLNDTSINGQLTIGSQFIFANNSINVLGGDLELQPLKQGGVSIASRQVYIDSNGNLSVKGDATFNGNLSANIISPLPNNNLVIKLGADEATNSALVIQNATGSAVLSLNQIGDLIASGAASFNKLNLNLISPALAISDNEVVATGSAGTARIKALQKELTIDNKLVTADSLIYITPVGTPSGQMPFLMRQNPQKSFTVGIEKATENDIYFNFLIVN